MLDISYTPGSATIFHVAVAFIAVAWSVAALSVLFRGLHFVGENQNQWGIAARTIAGTGVILLIVAVCVIVTIASALAFCGLGELLLGGTL